MPSLPVDKDLAKLVKEMTDLYLKYVTFTDPQHAFVCALWCAMTWLFRAETVHGLDSVGYLTFVSPERNCGKTEALKVTGSLCYGQPEVTVNPSTATIFREVDKFRTTLILDELDCLQDNPALVGVLNAGYKAGAKVTRMVGERYDDVKKFHVFGPKALGYIRDSDSLRILRATLESRCIRILLKRRTAYEQQVAARLRHRILAEEANPIVRRLVQWEMKRAPDLRPIFDSEILVKGMDDFNGREIEVWEGIFAVAHLAGVLGKAQAEARKLVIANREELYDHINEDYQLLQDIKRNLSASCDEDGFSLDLAVEWLQQMPHRDYGETKERSKGPWLSSTKLAIILGKYGLRSRPCGVRRVRRIPREALLDVIERYAPRKVE